MKEFSWEIEWNSYIESRAGNNQFFFESWHQFFFIHPCNGSFSFLKRLRDIQSISLDFPGWGMSRNTRLLEFTRAEI
jgi:hypothetical protein